MTDVSEIIALKEQMEKQKDVVNKANEKLFELEKTLKKKCNHPATKTLTDSMDDEYGKYWYSTRAKKCVFCDTVFDNEISYGYDGKWEKRD